MKINLFILGLQRSGTTSLYELLKQSSNISFTLIKETNIFSDNIFKNLNHNKHSSFKLNLDNLKSYIVKKTNSKYLIEASVNHFYSIMAPKKIYDYNPNSKFIIIYRKPIDRIKSHYLMDVSQNYHSIDINKCLYDEIYKNKIIGSDLGYLKMSKFSFFFKNWLKYFNRNKFLLIDFECIKEQTTLNKKLEKFLSIEIKNKILKTNSSYKFKNKLFLKLFFLLKENKFISKRLNNFKKCLPLFLSKNNEIKDLDKKTLKDLDNYFFKDTKYFNLLKD